MFFAIGIHYLHSVPMKSEKLRISAPFNAPIYRHANGLHPLLIQIIEHSSIADFLPAETDDPTFAAYQTAFRSAETLGVDILTNLAAQVSGSVDEKSVLEYLLWRDITSQAMMRQDVDLVFHHTVPLTLGNLPWILHIENLTTIFWPHLNHGLNRDVSLRRQPVYWIIRRVLERPDFRGLFTHMKQTADAIHTVFDSKIISDKVHYAPLGAHMEPRHWALAQSELARKHAPGRTVEILFTNSWHQAPENFLNRGGLDAVRAVLRLLESHPDTHLTIRSSLPTATIDPGFAKVLLEHPKITLLDKKISDDEIIELYTRADIFLLPSAALHSLSILRAMQCGAVCVVSDASGFSEFIDHERTGIIISGRHDQVETKDPETGWLQDDYESMKRSNPAIVERIAASLSALCRQPAMRRSIAEAARVDCEKRFPFENFRRGFEDLVGSVVEDDGRDPTCSKDSFGSALARSLSTSSRFFPAASPQDAVPAEPMINRVSAQLIEDSDQYNLVQWGDNFAAIAKSLGPTFLFVERLGERDLGDVVIRDRNLDSLRARVKELERKNGRGRVRVTLLKEMKHYNLVRMGESFVALSKDLGVIHPMVERIGERDLGDLVLKGATIDDLELRIKEMERRRALQMCDQTGMSGSPILVEAYGGYNLVQYLGRYWALPLHYGEMNIAREADRTRPGVLSAASLEEVKRLCDESGRFRRGLAVRAWRVLRREGVRSFARKALRKVSRNVGDLSGVAGGSR